MTSSAVKFAPIRNIKLCVNRSANMFDNIWSRRIFLFGEFKQISPSVIQTCKEDSLSFQKSQDKQLASRSNLNLVNEFAILSRVHTQRLFGLMNSTIRRNYVEALINWSEKRLFPSNVYFPAFPIATSKLLQRVCRQSSAHSLCTHSTLEAGAGLSRKTYCFLPPMNMH
jgi:hypothetical protein